VTPIAVGSEAAMREALGLAARNVKEGHGGPFGAVIVRQGVIVSRGWNQVTSTNDPTAHAEVVAIRAACRTLGTFLLAGHELYTSCEPCPMCLAAAYWARVDRIWFAGTRRQAAAAGFSDDDIYEEIPRPLEQRTLSIRPLLPDEGQGPFDAWAKKQDRIPY
jgi:guanine deaminase